MQDITATLIQKDLHWENPRQNIIDFESLLLKIEAPSDLVILPEMFTTGFSMQPHKFAEAMHGPTTQWLQKMANQTNKTIIGSLIIKENNKYYNRLIWASPNQPLQKYDKRHLFSYGHEDDHYTAGNAILESTIKNWKIRPLICYDLRFPVWSRNTTDYDLLVYVANWPTRRIEHWRSLLIARAIENQCFVIGLNRIGKDKNGIEHNGNSMIISPKGVVLSELIGEEIVHTVKLSKTELLDYRKQFPALLDRD